MKRILVGGLVAVALAFALALCGCELPFLRTAEPVQPGTIPPVQFKDIPIPLEFEFLPDKSWSHVAPSFRTGVMNDKGDTLLSRSKSFFASEMPASGWDLVELREPSRNAAIMKFSKGEETCTVTLRRADNLIYLTVEIRE